MPSSHARPVTVNPPSSPPSGTRLRRPEAAPNARAERHHTELLAGLLGAVGDPLDAEHPSVGLALLGPALDSLRTLTCLLADGALAAERHGKSYSLAGGTAHDLEALVERAAHAFELLTREQAIQAAAQRRIEEQLERAARAVDMAEAELSRREAANATPAPEDVEDQIHAAIGVLSPGWELDQGLDLATSGAARRRRVLLRRLRKVEAALGLPRWMFWGAPPSIVREAKQAERRLFAGVGRVAA